MGRPGEGRGDEATWRNAAGIPPRRRRARCGWRVGLETDGATTTTTTFSSTTTILAHGHA